LVAPDRSRRTGAVEVSFGTVRVTTQVVGFLRRLPSGEVIGQHPLDLPPRSLETKGVWWTITPEALQAIGLDEARWPGALHAAEHAAIGLLPLVASSDRWDIGGVSTALHPDTGRPTVLVYDGYPGGAGFADQADRRLDTWLRATRDAILQCHCSTGCPACIQSPKCGNGNEPLDKSGAAMVLTAVLTMRADTRDAEGTPVVGS
jgi:DEAD/DEAH box helicase domain-containing protein